MENYSKRSVLKLIILALVFGLVGGYFASYIPKSSNKLIGDHYASETAVLVSPHGLRKHISDDEFVIVDLRSQEEYETAHVVTALNVPAYATPDKSDYGAVERIVSSFEKIIEENPDKDIVVYCYSMPCMTGRKIGKMLSDNGIYVKELGIGWQEWRYYWNLWNHDGETKVNPVDYVHSGSEPGVFEGEGGTACPLGGNFGC